MCYWNMSEGREIKMQYEKENKENQSNNENKEKYTEGK